MASPSSTRRGNSKPTSTWRWRPRVRMASAFAFRYASRASSDLKRRTAAASCWRRCGRAAAPTFT
eukprot:1336048-Prymnesium_polylepis.1